MTPKICLIFILSSALNIYAGPCKIPVNESFDSVPLIDFIQYIEKKQDVHFFFKSDWIDSLYITNNKVPNTLDEILQENFRGTRLSFYIYNCRDIILFKDYAFVEDIPPAIFNYSAQTELSEASNVNISSFISREDRTEHPLNRGIMAIGDISKKYTAKFANITGFIRDTVNKAPVPGAVIYFDNFKSATITDANGYYSTVISTGSHIVHIKCVGKIEKSRKIQIYSDGKFSEFLEDDALSFREVYIYANKENNIRDIQPGIEKMDYKTIRQIPSSFGEADILKLVLLLPGVKTVGEGASGFNVRGGNADQNLILVDNSPVYNSSHLFGFFSTINPEMVQDFELFKSSYPAYYGGRLSSIFNVTLKKGNDEKFSVKGGISPITGHFLVEGPIIKKRVSFIISGRTTYSDWILRKIHSGMAHKSSASFYDFNAKVNANINKNNSLQLSSYYSNDYYKLNYDTSYTYKNFNSSLIWKHTFNDRLFITSTGVFSEYKFSISSDAIPLYSFDHSYGIQHYEGRIDVSYLPDDKNKIRWGISTIKYSLNPGTFTPGKDAVFNPLQLEQQQGIESAVYVNDEFKLNDNLLLNIGFRYSFYYSLGPAKVYKYGNGAGRSLESRIDSNLYSRNEITGNYANPEFRISARYQLSENSSLKASYAKMAQYIHMLTNTMAISPTDTWVLSNPNMKPVKGWQFSLGYYRNFYNNMFETSIETYYKESKNIPEFKPGAQLVLNPDLELDLLAGKGLAYGAEFMIRKKLGKYSGWISYTYSRALIKVDGRYLEEQINSGRYYPANFDKPHDLTWVSNFKFSRRIAFTSTVIYNTGHPITYPVAWYTIRGRDLLHYSNRNEYRVPDYFRIDLSLNIDGNLKIKRSAHSSWSFSVYNLTGRKNVYSIYFLSDPYKRIQGYKLSIFARPIFSITYNFKF